MTQVDHITAYLKALRNFRDFSGALLDGILKIPDSWTFRRKNWLSFRPYYRMLLFTFDKYWKRFVSLLKQYKTVQKIMEEARGVCARRVKRKWSVVRSSGGTLVAREREWNTCRTKHKKTNYTKLYLKQLFPYMQVDEVLSWLLNKILPFRACSPFYVNFPILDPG